MPTHVIKRSTLSFSLSLSAWIMTIQNNVKILPEVDGFIMPPNYYIFPCLNDIHKRILWVGWKCSFAKSTRQHCHGNGSVYFVHWFYAVLVIVIANVKRYFIHTIYFACLILVSNQDFWGRFAFYCCNNSHSVFSAFLSHFFHIYAEKKTPIVL